MPVPERRVQRLLDDQLGALDLLGAHPAETKIDRHVGIPGAQAFLLDRQP